MASKDLAPPEGFKISQPDNDDEAKELELEPGDEFTGLVMQIRSGEKNGDPWHRLKLKPEDGSEVVEWWAEGEAKALCTKNELTEGAVLWIARMPFTETYTDSDGTEHEFYPVEAAYQE